MKYLLIIVMSVAVLSSNPHERNSSKVIEYNKEIKSTYSDTQKQENGVIKNGTYICSIMDWNISIPKEYSVYYPNGGQNSTNRIPGLIQNQLNENSLVYFGRDDKNYFSAYVKPSTGEQNSQTPGEVIRNPVLSFKEVSRQLCNELESRYSDNREIAFKQNLRNETINAIKYDVYNIQLVSYPDDTPIVHQVVYLSKETDRDVYFSVTYDNEKDKKDLMNKLMASLQ